MEILSVFSVLFLLFSYGSNFYAAGLWGGMAAAPIGSIGTLLILLGQPWHWTIAWFPTGVFLIVNSLIPILSNSTLFGVFVVALVVICRFVMGYCKALVYVRVQQKVKKDGMFLVAIAQQVGAFVGSLMFFLLVNYSSWYTD
jgi:hypothetical protein